MPSPVRPSIRLLRWLFAAAAVIAVCLLFWGDNLLIADDPPPGRVDAVIVLQGSIVAEKNRVAGAIDLLQRGLADRALLSVPKESYWGQSIPPLARSYIERNYGGELATRIDFCETSAEVNSTGEEAQVLSTCIKERPWHLIVIVTSNYHTRRAGMLWRRVTKNDPKIHIWVEGVTEPEFQHPWWRHRQSAKIWLMETAKLVWTVLGGT
jgi:uncharacterized SAM-binding protein YcdF (DUF218 family)